MAIDPDVQVLLDAQAARISALEAAGTGGGPKTRFVSKAGDDANDGLSWGNAKLTVAAAVQSLPDEGSAGSLRKSGDIHIAEGEYVETAIECSSNIRFHGSGVPVGPSSSGGTVIKMGAADHLFAPRATFTDFAHTVVFSDLMLDGNGQVGDFDLLRLRAPGFNTALYNVFFKDAPRHGLHVSHNMVNFYAYNCSAAGCGENHAIGSFFTYDSDVSANLTTAAFFGLQVDNSGPYPIRINSHGAGRGTISFYGLEFEGTATTHDACIFYDPIEGSNGLSLTVDGLAAWRSGTQGQAPIMVGAGPGGSPTINWRNVIKDNYAVVYRDQKAGFDSNLIDAGFVRSGDWQGIQFGKLQFHTAPVNPEGQVSAPPGSMCFVPGLGSFEKISGTGNTGWQKT